MIDNSNSIDLGRFTFDSLYFCQTPLSAYRGDQFMWAFNRWYMTAIRGGLAPPFGFLLDVGNLLLRPSLGLDHRPMADIKPEIRELLRNYGGMLRHLREQSVFAETAVLVEEISDVESQFRAVGQFLKYLLVELNNLGAAYVFQSRQLLLRNARVNSKGLSQVEGIYVRAKLPTTIVRDAMGQSPVNEFAPLVSLFKWISEFYSRVPLKSFFSAEKRLMVELAARNPFGVNAVDFCMVKRLLDQPDICAPEELEPLPRFVELTVPTESMQVDGPTSGYVDIQTCQFKGNIGDILPTELALALPGDDLDGPHREVDSPTADSLTSTEPMNRSTAQYQFYQRLVNGGVPHYVRENIVCIEREFRVLTTFVVDARPQLRRLDATHADSRHAGVNPYIRSRTLVASMLRDLALYFPRNNVRLEAAVYLYDCEAQTAYRRHINLLDEISLDIANTPLRFAGRLAQLAPHFFDHRNTYRAKEDRRDALDPNPFQFARHRHAAQNFHSRHFVLLTTQALAGSLVESLGDPGVTAGPRLPNLNLAVYCDANYNSVGLAMPGRWSEVSWNSDEQGRLGESDLRARFIDEVHAKAAGRTAGAHDIEMGEVVT